MKICIIGAGGSGLTAAWLLEEEHDVTLFEKETRLGGHAYTENVEIDGETFAVDAGFEFFSAKMFPTFYALLNILNVELNTYPMTVTFHHADDPKQTTVLPPFRDGGVVWSAFRPRPLGNMIQMQRALNHATNLIESQDKLTTIGEFLETAPVSRRFRDEFMYPFLLAGWDVEPDVFKGFSAYNSLKYTFLNQPSGLTPILWNEVVGGTQMYVNAIRESFQSADVRLGTAVASIVRHENHFVVEDSHGETHQFDKVVVATNAAQAAKILKPLGQLAELVTQLERITYFKTPIAVHGDTRFMPADEKHWSIVNFRHNGRYCENTVWKPWRGRKNLFRSWVTYADELPDPLYSMVTHDHPWADRAYFETQAYVTENNGREDVWVAGLYTQHEDSHESAVCSGVEVARNLAPNSKRLQQLLTRKQQGQEEK